MTENKVFLHVGTPKSGTSSLQSLLWTNRNRLRQRGLLYPGDHEADHFRAAVDFHNEGYVDDIGPEILGSWGRLVDEVRRHEGTSVISHELLADRDDDDALRMVADLAPAQVHVLITARDLARQLPASWQEDLKNRHTRSFPDWMDDVRRRTTARHAELFWRRQDLPTLVDRWSAHVGPDRVHVVTVPPSGGADDILWARVASVLGITPEGERRHGTANKSLGVVEAELVRRLNERADYGIDWPTYATRVTWYLAGFVLPERAGRVPVVMSDADRPWVAETSRRYVRHIQESAVDIVGDLDDLLVAPSGHGLGPSSPDDGQLLDAALDALVALLVQDPRWVAMAPPT